ncbi:MAG: Glu/Leu/Phe/Val dehydrogenase [Sphingomonadales bacterium]|nr:MAG: Glu/Leu/Phe/Val dehydrogenase [Sphingomonadales bacterium]TNF03724.1 MAG: Glu/Leu/Phe/Val dehydrogenase [Sphingomonadales bacterium]
MLSGALPAFEGSLHYIDDEGSGLRGVIAVHSTALGPAAGGCRFWQYESNDAMVADAIRLARGMSYKNALAGLPFGGGKSVLQHPGGDFDREALFRAFGEAIESLGGKYITAEDVGTTVEDMKTVRKQTSYVAGLETAPGMAGGDPSPWTALGVFLSMQEAARISLGSDLKGLTVAVQGVGNVGAGLCRLLVDAGAKLIIADVNSSRVDALAKELGADVMGTDEILGAQVEILAPCALGAVINDRTVPQLKARLVCGGANNQLATEEDGFALQQRGIAYAPDYLVNAGGIINVAAEYLHETTDEVRERVGRIPERLREVLLLAAQNGQPTHRVADAIAERIISGSRAEVA